MSITSVTGQERWTTPGCLDLPREGERDKESDVVLYIANERIDRCVCVYSQPFCASKQRFPVCVPA